MSFNRIAVLLCASMALRVHPALRVCLPFFACLALGGCNLIGVIADKAAGDRPVPPAYQPDPLQPLLVIAENYREGSGSNSDADRVQRKVSELLQEKKVAPIVSSDQLQSLRDRSPTSFRKMSVVEIGRAVGAMQVVYIDLTGVGVGTHVGSDSHKGNASALVQLVDVTTGGILFPRDLDSGAPIGFESPLRRITTQNTPDRVRAETLIGLSERISRLFHSFRPSDLERLGDGEP